MKRIPVKKIAYSAVVAAMYFALTLLLQPISFGPVQFRLSEALVMLPYIMPESILGITIGCAAANAFSTFPVYDVIFGSLATLIAGILTSKIKNAWLSGLPPVLLNALVLPLMWYLLGTDAAYWVNLISITLSEAVVIFFIGVPLVLLIKKKVPSLVTRKAFLDETPADETKRTDAFVSVFFVITIYCKFLESRIFAYRSRAIRAILSLTVYYTPL